MNLSKIILAKTANSLKLLVENMPPYSPVRWQKPNLIILLIIDRLSSGINCSHYFLQQVAK